MEKVVTAQYLIGADGATSKVRERMRGGWHDLGYFFDWLVVDVQPKPELQFPHVATQTCDVARPCTMVPGGPGRRRWEFMLLPHERRLKISTAPTGPGNCFAALWDQSGKCHAGTTLGVHLPRRVGPAMAPRPSHDRR